MRAYAAVPGDDVDYHPQLRNVARRAGRIPVLVAVDPDGRVLGGVAYVPGPGRRIRSRSVATRPGSGCSPSIRRPAGGGSGGRCAGLHRPGARRGPERRSDPDPAVAAGRPRALHVARVHPRPVARHRIRPGSLAVVVRPDLRRSRMTSEPVEPHRRRRSSCCVTGTGRSGGPPDAAAGVDGVRGGHARLPRRAVDPGDSDPRWSSVRRSPRPTPRSALGGDLEPSAAHRVSMSPRSASCSRRPASSWPSARRRRSASPPSSRRGPRWCGGERDASPRSRRTSTCGCGPTC